jgi:4-aminobutyrate aminotransferase/(S)-3-amino-2-methylpropionate transaminase
MDTMSKRILDRRADAVPRGVANVTPVVIAHAEGAMVKDVEGKEYIDFAGGIGSNNIGHRHPAVLQAIREQTERYLHACFHVSVYEPYIALCERLNALVPCRGKKKTLLANSGAEAVENAVKIARYFTGRPAIICFEGAFHGRTLTAMALTSKVMPYKFKLGAMLSGVFRAHYPYCYRCPWGKTYPDCRVYCGERYFENEFFKYHVNPDEVAAMVIEPVLGEGGFIHPPMEYLGQLRSLCDRHGIVLVLDEVQTGFARTGRMFAAEHFGVEADIMTLAKSLGGGLPLSAVTGASEIMDSVHPGGLGGTFGGNPLACAAALAVLGVMESEGLVRRAADLGLRVRDALEAMARRYPVIGEVRGLGAMQAIELVRDPKTRDPAPDLAKKLTAYCHAHGLIILDCGTLGNNIRTLMPLVITDEQLTRGLSILDAGFRSLSPA